MIRERRSQPGVGRPPPVRAAAQGIDTIVYLVGVNYWQFELHPQLMKRQCAFSASREKVRAVRSQAKGVIAPFEDPSPVVAILVARVTYHCIGRTLSVRDLAR